MTKEDHGRALLEQARLAMALLQDSAPNGNSTIEEHNAARDVARSAMNWLEDLATFSEAHAVLDEIGALTRKFKPEACALEFAGDDYFETCAVSLAHSRVGLSAGLVIEEMACSICDLDPRDCDHLSGEEHEGTIAHRVIKKAKLLEVSVVARPAHPDARITRVSLSREVVRSALRDMPRGTRLVCDQCLHACAGLSERVR